MTLPSLLISGAAVLIAVVVVTATGFGGLLQSPAAKVDARVDEILSKMSLEEKIDFIGGTGGFYIRDVPRLGIPKMLLADGPFGIRNHGNSTAVAGGIALAATWNPVLAERVGVEIGRDARARGVHFFLAPGVNIYRAPMNGRNFEYYGEDPLLAGRIAVGLIKGVQSQGVSATVKHFLGNNSEFDRHNTDSLIDERALREIYLPAFEAAVRDGQVAAIMTSYNLVNGEHMSEYGAINNDIVKKEWGFDGVLMSDWTATYDPIKSANGGLDLEMPAGDVMNRKNLLPLINEGKVSPATIDDKVRRILRVAVRMGWLDRPQKDPSIPAINPRGAAVALESAREGIVLLKNDGNLLPLQRGGVTSIAVIGPLSHPAVPVGGGSAAVQPHAAVSIHEGLARALGSTVSVTRHQGIPSVSELADRTAFFTEAKGGAAGLKMEAFPNLDLTGTPGVSRVDPRINIAAEFGARGEQGSSARWTGYYTPDRAGAHRLAVQTTRGDGGYRVFVDDTLVLDNWQIGRMLVSSATVPLTPGPHRIVLEQFRRREWGNAATRLGIIHEDLIVDAEAKALAQKADVVIAAVGFDTETEGEASDRTFALPVGQDDLIRTLLEANRRTIVTVTSGGGVDMTGWIDRVPALVQMWYAGQEGGAALAELLLGDANFSGRLPVSFERQWQDNPSRDSYYPAPGTVRVKYTDGVFVGYRGYQKNNVKPLFPFGFGLSYTQFGYRNLVVTPRDPGQRLYDVSFEITNTGKRPGATVGQVYVAEMKPRLPRPHMELRGFAKVSLAPGETTRATVTLDARAFSYYDTSAHQWRADAGEYEILLGASSDEFVLKTKLTLDGWSNQY